MLHFSEPLLAALWHPFLLYLRNGVVIWTRSTMLARSCYESMLALLYVLTFMKVERWRHLINPALQCRKCEALNLIYTSDEDAVGYMSSLLAIGVSVKALELFWALSYSKVSPQLRERKLLLSGGRSEIPSGFVKDSPTHRWQRYITDRTSCSCFRRQYITVHTYVFKATPVDAFRWCSPYIE